MAAVTWAAWEACRGYSSYHMGMGCMVGPTHQLATHVRLQISVTPHAQTPVERNGQSGLHILLHRRRLCTQGCPCVRTRSGIIVLTLGTQLSPQRVVSATITSSRHVRILVLLLGLKRLGNTDGATLSICCLNASVSLACSG